MMSVAKALTNYQNLVRDIRQGQIEPLYFFYGPELVLARYVASVLREELITPGMEDINYTRIDGQKATEAEIVRAIVTPPMFGAKRLVVIEQPAFVKPRKGASYEQWEALLKDWPAFTCVVLLAPDVDKRLRAFKTLAERAASYEFPALTVVEAANWVEGRLRRAKISFPARTGRFVVDRCGTDLELLRLEVEKMVSFAAGKSLSQTDLDLLVRDDVETNIFDLVDAIGLQDFSRAWPLLVRMLDEGNDPVYLISMIGRQLRLLLVARHALDAGLSQRQAAARLGIHPFPAGKCVQQAQHWTIPKLNAALLNCLQADENIKSGDLKGPSALHQLLLDLTANPG